MKKNMKALMIMLVFVMVLSGCGGNNVEQDAESISNSEEVGTGNKELMETEIEENVLSENVIVDDVYIEEDGEFLKITADEDDILLVTANGGVVVTYKDECYGAIDYKGNQLVPNVYPKYYRTVNSEGQFILGSEENAIVFDAKGEEILEVDNPLIVEVSEGVVSYVTNDSLQIYVYDIKTKETAEYEGYGWCTGKRNGFIYYDDGMGIGAITKNGSITGTLQKWFLDGGLESWYDLYFPVGIKNGYGAVNSAQPTRAGIANEDFSEIILMDMEAFYSQESISKDSSWSYKTYYENGLWYVNDGEMTVIEVNFSDGTKCSYLLDFGYAELAEKKTFVEDDGIEYTEQLVSNIEDVIVAKYKSITLSESGNYLASDGEDWFYIDEFGNELGRYSDAAQYNSKGYAAVIEDGIAYVVDTEFNKLTDGYEADSVQLAGEALCVTRGFQKTFFIMQE